MNKECDVCRGTGESRDDAYPVCDACGGTGQQSDSVYKVLAETRAELARLREALAGYDFTRYADTFSRHKEALSTAVAIIEGRLDRESYYQRDWYYLAQTCDADHLTSFAKKWAALLPPPPEVTK